MKNVRISPLLVCLLCVSIYFGWGSMVGAAILAVLCHELGHVAAIFLCRKRITSISFGVIGAAIETEPMTYRQELLCASMGPLINFILFSICYRFNMVFGLVNLILLVYNILPVYPLDGGRMLRAFLLIRISEDKVRRIVHIISAIFTAILMISSVCIVIYLQWGLWPMFLAAMILWKTGMAASRDGY